ncbi:MAG: hypothetical protein PUD10_06945 [Lachnospira sp.]|nr:hypothetical protein [Lachnospira sp.]
MAEQNILAGNVKVLEQVLSDINEHNAKKDRLDKLESSIKEMNKELDNSKKSMNDEISSRIKESTDAISAGYDKSISSNKEKLKELQAERDKAKLAGIKERIEAETASLRNENEDLQQQINEAFIQENISKFYNSRLFFALFSSKQAADVLIYILINIVLFAAIPVALYFIPVIPYWSLLIYYFIVSVGMITFCKIIYKKKFIPNADIINAAQDTYIRIGVNRNKIKKIKNGIKKDKNEEMYGLEVFDTKINEIHDDCDRIENEKKAALDEFDKTAREDIISEIEGRFSDKIKNIEDELSKKNEEYQNLDDLVKKQRIYISSNYEAYLGKEFTNTEKLTELVSIMKSGAADTIGQAVAAYKNRH